MLNTSPLSDMCVCSVTQSCPAHQVPLSMEFSMQEYWSGLPFPSSGDLPDQGLNPHLLCLLHWQADSLSLSHRGSPLFFIFSFYLISHLWLTQRQLYPGNGLSPWLPKPSTSLVLHYLPGYFLSVFLTGIVSL